MLTEEEVEPSAQSVELVRRFIEERLGLELDETESDRSLPSQRSDLDAIWASGSGADSLAEAIGRVLVAASDAVSDLAPVETLDATRAVVRPVEAPVALVEAPPASVETAAIVAPPTVPPPVAPPTVAPPPIAPEEVAVAAAPAVAPPVEVPVVPVAAPVAPEEAAATVAPPPVAPLETPVAPVEEVQPVPAAARAARARSRARVAYRAFGWVRGIGLIVILFAVWQLWGTGIAQHQAQSSLRTQFEAEIHSAAPTSHAASLISATAHVAVPADGSAIARLQIPAIGVNEIVVEGTGEQDLAKGPGHYAGTAMPGQAGNVAIAGHRTTYGAPFFHLNAVVSGDTIVLTTNSGEQLTYVVQQKAAAVSPRDLSVLNYFNDNRITLTTCNPVFSASQRLVLVGYLQGALNRTAPNTPVAKVVEPKITTGFSGWRWSYLPESLVLVALLVMLALAFEKISARLGKWGRWLFLVPVWVAGLYLLFSALGNLLPASV